MDPIDSRHDPALWQRRHPSWQLRLATAWARHAPRGKSAIPRFIGHYLSSRVRDTMTTQSGARLAIDFANLDAYSSLRSHGGVCDPHVLEACCRHLRQGAVFYDVGANVGSISLEIAQRFNDSVRVLAFEPQPSLAQAIATSAAINGFRRVEVFATALGDTAGTTTLFLPRHCGRASLLALNERCTRIACPIATLDSLHHLPPPDVIKIDVEGLELSVFRGGRNLIAEHRPIIVFEAYESLGRRQVCDELKQIADYRLFRLFKDGTTEPMESPPSGQSFQDVLAVPVHHNI